MPGAPVLSIAHLLRSRRDLTGVRRDDRRGPRQGCPATELRSVEQRDTPLALGWLDGYSVIEQNGDVARRAGAAKGRRMAMMVKRTTIAAVLVGCATWSAPAHAQRGGPPDSPFAYALFALGDLTLRDGVRAVDGDVGSNNGTTTVGKNVRVAGDVVGRTITLRKGALPDALFCLLLRGAASTMTCQAVTLPVVNASQLPPVQVVAGTMDVRVPSDGSTSPIPAGAYGDVRVAPRGVLILAGGTYVFKSINVNPRGQLLCAAACQIGVADRVRIRSNAMLGGTGGTRAEAIRVNVAKTSGKTVFAADNRSNVSAVVYAPGGRIALRNRGNYVGAFVGGTIKVDQGALVQARRP
jgi:hypothetical protein